MLYFDSDTLKKLDEIKATAMLPSRTRALTMAIDRFWKAVLASATRHPTICLTQSYDDACGRTIAQIREIAMILEVTDSVAAVRAIDRMWLQTVRPEFSSLTRGGQLVTENSSDVFAAEDAAKASSLSMCRLALAKAGERISRYLSVAGIIALGGQMVISLIDMIKHLVYVVRR